MKKFNLSLYDPQAEALKSILDKANEDGSLSNNLSELLENVNEYLSPEDYDLPLTPYYCFITGERNSYAVIPEFFDDELYGYYVVRVGLNFVCEIQEFHFIISNIPEILERQKGKEYSIVDQLVNYPDDNVRTEDQFSEDLNRAINKIYDTLNFGNAHHRQSIKED